MKTTKPRVFISSTISDFSDVRSSIKWWLEELGFDVQASEFTDFDKKPGHDTISACLDLVRRSDHFILLIGDRKGSTLDNGAISITHLEYKTAHESYIKTGFPKITVFLRSSTATKICDRSPNPADTDIRYIRDFVHEIKKANIWVNDFANFQDIIQALQIGLNAKNPIKKKVLEANLIWELEVNMKTFFQDFLPKGKYSPKHTLFPATTFKNLHFSSEEMARLPVTNIQKPKLLLALMFLIYAGDLEHLHTTALENAISSGEFLEYQRESGEYAVGQTQEALLRLRTSILSYKQQLKIVNTRDRITELLEKNRQSALIPVPLNELASLAMLYNFYFQVYHQIFYFLQYIYKATPEPKICNMLPIQILGETVKTINGERDPILSRQFIKNYILSHPQ